MDKSQPRRLALPSPDRHRSLGGSNAAVIVARDNSRSSPRIPRASRDVWRSNPDRHRSLGGSDAEVREA
jgi:hypothetical protein